MKTFSFAWTDALGSAVGMAAPKPDYHMSWVAEDRQKVIAAVNQGIDSYLEACFVPGGGERFRLQTPAGIGWRMRFRSGERDKSPNRLNRNSVLPRSLLQMFQRLVKITALHQLFEFLVAFGREDGAEC